MGSRIAVVGAGAWGTALAIVLARNDQPTVLWTRDPAQRAALKTARCNQKYLPDAVFPDGLQIVETLDDACDACDAIVLAVPAAAVCDLLTQINAHGRHYKLCITSKGLDLKTHGLMSVAAKKCLGDHADIVVLSGPSFAREVAAGLPTAVTIAGDRFETATWFAGKFHNDVFRVYTHDDLIGVQIGGATKNVIAIAAGIADGLGFGANTRAALITRGLAEISRFADTLGGRRETLMGLTGIGDLILSCTDNQSRNRQFGLALAAGATVADACRQIKYVIEGIETARIVSALAVTHGVEMPIVAAVCQVVNGECTADSAVRTLLTRVPGREL